MHLQTIRGVSSLLGMLLYMSSFSPVTLAVDIAQTQTNAPATACSDERRGQVIEALTKELIYRSDRYSNSGSIDLAARSLTQALRIVPTVENSFTKTDLIATIAGNAGGQPSTMERIVNYSISTKQPKIALDLLPKIAQVAQTLNGEYGVINVKRSILTQLANYYTRLGQPNQARPLLDQARQALDSLQGDGFGLIAAPVAEGYIAIGDTAKAIAILNQALQRTEAMKTNNETYLGDIFQSISTAYANAGAMEQALQVAQRIKVANSKSTALTHIASRYAQAGKPQQANTIFAQALKLAQTSPQGNRASLISQIAIKNAQVGQFDKGLQVAQTIAAADAKARTIAEIAALYDRANQFEKAVAILPSISASGKSITPFYDADTLFREIFADYISDRQYKLAFQFSQTLDLGLQSESLLKLVEEASAAGDFPLALRVVEVIPPGWQNQVKHLSLRHLAAGYAKARKYDQAMQLLQSIEDSSDYPNRTLARVAIAKSYTENGQRDKAIEQLNQSLKALSTLKNSSAKIQALSQIAVGYAQAGQRDRAVDVHTQALKIQDSLNPGAPASPSYAVEQLVNQYLGVQQYPLALQLVQTLKGDYEHDRELQRILNQMLEVGELQPVLQTANTIRNPNQKVAFLVKIADFHIGTGQTDKAAEILAQAFAIAQTLEGPEERFAGEAAQIDPSIPFSDEFDRGSLIEAIAIRYAELRQHNLATQTAQALQSSTYRERVLQRLACYR
jgi:lipopolysaccharide biosynthesis regulator YciM